MCYNNTEMMKVGDRKMDIKYITTEVIKNEDGFYGILVHADNRVTEYINISSSEEKVSMIAEAINRNKVSPLHLYEILEDLLE